MGARFKSFRLRLSTYLRHHLRRPLGPSAADSFTTLRLQRRVVAPRDDITVGRRLRYFPRPPNFENVACGWALSVDLAPPDGRRLRLRGFVRYRRESARRRRLSGARVRGFTKAAPGLALCWEVEGHWCGARPRGVGRAVGAVAAGFGVRAPLILRVVLVYTSE